MSYSLPLENYFLQAKKRFLNLTTVTPCFLQSTRSRAHMQFLNAPPRSNAARKMCRSWKVSLNFCSTTYVFTRAQSSKSLQSSAKIWFRIFSQPVFWFISFLPLFDAIRSYLVFGSFFFKNRPGKTSGERYKLLTFHIQQNYNSLQGQNMFQPQSFVRPVDLELSL